ncbi:pyridoxal-phosphate dependent enzyme [Methylomarinum sp. Ch1-1]|uniref:Pyridoxal-phosphate dependent enzyme n=1 Tax=Methylomarinum roseum TaxID=3067653 RepID=A0AAU7NS93_9GAMM|nr:pyridoxal-phosphate dependent enzyme [Methylomarinum sp. Ch1-1]MDP4520203.1 pyridoxal-phosphate dependent enzyme [Methylomarinum sp. Ch1-1]
MRLQELERRLSPSPLIRIEDTLLREQGVELWLKRDDLLHPVISGNKWRKLKYILNHALSLGCRRIISMGGAYSNHLHALAYAGKLLGVETSAFIRGERPETFSPTLKDIRHWGMDLNFVSRGDYRELRSYKRHDSLPGLSAGEYWLPEGGSTDLALQGVAEIVGEIDRDYDVLCAPCGTGTTLAGLIAAVPEAVEVIGIAALKGADFLYDDVSALLPDGVRTSWKIELDFHFGGFAKRNDLLCDFIDHFEKRQGIALEPVYTGKMLFALYHLIEQGCFSAGQRIIAVHTGGLQGRRH